MTTAPSICRPRPSETWKSECVIFSPDMQAKTFGDMEIRTRQNDEQISSWILSLVRAPHANNIKADNSPLTKFCHPQSKHSLHNLETKIHHQLLHPENDRVCSARGNMRSALTYILITAVFAILTSAAPHFPDDSALLNERGWQDECKAKGCRIGPKGQGCVCK